MTAYAKNVLVDAEWAACGNVLERLAAAEPQCRSKCWG